MVDEAELKRLREAEALYRLTIENISDAVFVTDDAGRFVYVCPNADVIFGLSPDAVRAYGTIDALLDHPLVADLPADVPEVENIQLEITDDVGARHVVLASIKRAAVLHGSIIVVVRDITERWHLQRQLVRSERLACLDRFARGIAHDVDNLLQVIRNHSALLRMDTYRPAQVSDLDSIDDAVDHVARLVHDLSAYARGERARVGLSAVQPALDACTPMLTSAADPHRLTRSVDPGLPPIAFDAVALGRVLLNLVRNAAEATPGVGHIYLRVRALQVDTARPAVCGQWVEPGRYVLFEVSDAGVGMDPAVAERIFEPYFSTKPDGNSGVGLASSLSLVRAAGGQMTVDSQPGAGTTIGVYLPPGEAARAD